MLRPDTFALTALLALLTAIGPLSVDLYLPSLPEIGRVLAAPTAEVQLTISAYLCGFAGGQIIYGPQQVPGGSWIVHCFDPQGAMFALVGSKL
jgi:DHA1 family bicyclomycin/chloramphenicol resistance-like MFS transporter